jgi:16S rRNA (cytosine1402-N4)-methyltransferase
MDIERIHTPVMLERTLELLGPALARDGAVFVDATLGMGGHTAAVLERFPGATAIGVDRDPDALAIAGERLASFGDRVRYVHAVYDDIADAVRGEGFDEVHGILFDLGVSSLQLDRAERGFAYAKDAPLDMRMDPTRGRTAADIVAEYSEEDLRRIFRDYGEEKLAARYARAIVKARQSEPIVRSGRLVQVLHDATPVAVQRAGHPAKRVFQGRIVVLAYQSLEDRLVKRVLAAASSSTAPPGLPMELPEHRPQFRLLVRGAELASEAEQAENPRAKPVRLRAAERVRRPS